MTKKKNLPSKPEVTVDEYLYAAIYLAETRGEILTDLSKRFREMCSKRQVGQLMGEKNDKKELPTLFG